MLNDRSKLVSLAIAIAVPQIAGGIGSIATFRNIPTWYAGLRKPSWTPPSWLFAPVWTLLYTMMGVASWQIWRSGPDRPEVRQALSFYGVQLGLNTLWSLIFFGMRAPGLALVEIVALAGSIAGTALQFYRIRPSAGLLMLPYMGWTLFASTINAGVWWLNRGKSSRSDGVGQMGQAIRDTISLPKISMPKIPMPGR